MFLSREQKEDLLYIQGKDPAFLGASLKEVLAGSPGAEAIWVYRRAHKLWLKGKRLRAVKLARKARDKYGIEIHPGATIGKHFIIDHGDGVVIGETCIIGDECKLYQGVTLGCRGTSCSAVKRHPTLEDGVTVGVSALVLGDIIVGKGAHIGAGAVVIHNVLPGDVVAGIPAKSVKK